MLEDGPDVTRSAVNGSGGRPSSIRKSPTATSIGRLINEVGDDRDYIQPGDRVLLIVENDLAFARFLLDTARERGFKGLVTSLGAAALALTREHKPDAITLDIFLPDIGGWRVLERLKNDIATRHIPVCVISTDDAREQAFSSGAVAFVAKPISSRDVLDGLLGQLSEFIARAKKTLLRRGNRRRGLRPDPRVRSMPRTSRSSGHRRPNGPATAAANSASIAWS